jgi:hypothetical protein
MLDFANMLSDFSPIFALTAHSERTCKGPDDHVAVNGENVC